jgi:hypothetical protein
MDFIEIKMSKTLSSSHIKNILALHSLFPKTEDYVIYSGEQEVMYHNVKFVNWKNMDLLHFLIN